MNFFQIFVQGELFDIDKYLETSTLVFDEIWHRGDEFGHPLFIVDKRVGNGAIIRLGDGQTLPFYEQVRVATEFLEANGVALRSLTGFSGIETAYVSLQFKCEFENDVCGTLVSPSQRLMYFALRAGLDLDIYLDLERREDAADEED